MNSRNLINANRLRVIQERVNALLDDNYQVIVQSYSMLTCFAKLRHRTNGNVIKIKADITINYLQQFTNDKLVHEGVIIPV